MVRSLVDEDRTGVEGNVLGDTAGGPWIISSVDEQDVTVVVEVLLWVHTSEESWYEIVLWSESPLILAVFGMLFLVPTFPGVSTIGWITTNRPWKLRASLNIPTGTSTIKLMSIFRWSEAFPVLYNFVHC